MNISLDSFANFKPDNSIVTSGELDDSNDSSQPYTYIQWLTYSGMSPTDTNDYFAQYNTYLYNWANVRELSRVKRDSMVVNKYKTLLKDISLKYTNDEEKRFLSNLNLDNPRHIEAALPFFASKLKVIALHYSLSRDVIKQQKYVNDRSGTSRGVNYVAKHWVSEAHTRPSILTLSANVKPIRLRSTRINELYDIGSEFNKSIIDYDYQIYNNFTQAVRNVITECQPALKLTSELTLVLRGTINDIREESFPTEVKTLPDENFINYTRDVQNLNIEYKKDYIKELVGDTLFLANSGQLTTLIEPSKPWRNLLNRYGPTITNKPIESRLVSTRELGRFFLPQYTGLLTYYSLAPSVEYGESLSNDQVLPDLTKYGNSYVSGVTGLDITHIENVEWLKADTSNDQLHGDVISLPHVARFFGYMSADESRATSDHGMSRYTDKYDFFTGDLNDIWSHSDIYKLEAKNIYDIDARQDDMFVTHDTMCNWREDMYGNEYGMYKLIEQPRDPEFNPFTTEDEFGAQAGCVILDGGDTLNNRPTRFEQEYEIYDGGRHPKNDPKIEQFIAYTAFPDLRRMDPTTNQPIDHNTHYYGVDPEGKSGKLDFYPITFHGFDPFPNYDKQAYCGLFTDDACGIIGARYTNCAIADNYSFILFTEGPDSQGEYVSDPFPPEEGEFSAFERIANPMFSEFDPEIGFSEFGANSAVEVIEDDKLDGYTFAAECDFQGQDFKYEVDQTAELFLDEITVGKTKTVDHEDLVDYIEPSIYKQKSELLGAVNFRSYNDKVIDNISTALSSTWLSLDSIKNTAYEVVRENIRSEEILNFDVLNDVVIIETRDYLLLEKIDFEIDTTTIKQNKEKNILLNTGVNDDVEKNGDWFYDETLNELLICMTKTYEPPDSDPVVHPVIYSVDLNNLDYKQVFPNMDYGVEPAIEKFKLKEDLENSVVEFIDRPILTYNEDIDTYNVCYTAQLSSANDTKFCVMLADFKRKKLNIDILDTAVYHAKSVPRYVFPGKSWESRVDEKYIRLTVPEGEGAPVNGEVKTYNMSSNDFIGYALSGLGLTFDIDMKYLPVGDYKIISIILDPGDGSDFQYNQRLIENDFVDVSFDITKLPDQSDFGDPRRLTMSHDYEFTKGEDHTYTARVSAIYSDYSTLIFNIDIHTAPYSITSGFDGLKLINTKQYLDSTGSRKQLLVLESQFPRHVTSVALTL